MFKKIIFCLLVLFLGSDAAVAIEIKSSPCFNEQIEYIKEFIKIPYTIKKTTTIKSTHINRNYYHKKRLHYVGVLFDNGDCGIWIHLGTKSAPQLLQSVNATAKFYTPDLFMSYKTKARAYNDDIECKVILKYLMEE